MKLAAIFTAVLLALLLARIAPAQMGDAPSSPSTGYDLSWSSIDGGGGMSSDGSYTLNGSIGQPDAGALSGSGYTLNGGFWGVATQYRLYLPLILKYRL